MLCYADLKSSISDQLFEWIATYLVAKGFPASDKSTETVAAEGIISSTKLERKMGLVNVNRTEPMNLGSRLLIDSIAERRSQYAPLDQAHMT